MEENQNENEKIEEIKLIGAPTLKLDENLWKEKFGIDHIFQNGWFEGKLGIVLIDEKKDDIPYRGRQTSFHQEIIDMKEELEKECEAPFNYTIILRSTTKPKSENDKQMEELKLELERLHANGNVSGIVPMNYSFVSMTKNSKRAMNLYQNYTELQYNDNGGILVSLPTLVIRSIWSVVNHDEAILKSYQDGKVKLKDFWRILNLYNIKYGKQINEINQKELELDLNKTPENLVETNKLNQEKKELLSYINELTLSQYVNKKLDIDAICQVILNYNDFKEFVDKNIVGRLEVAYDVETNGKEKMSIDHKIVGFSLASEADIGCYVVFESIDYTMPSEDKSKIIKWLKENLFNKTFKKDPYNDDEVPEVSLWVYNAQHEVPVVYNHYGIFLRDIQDLFVMTKLLNCGRKLEKGGRGLKAQVMKLGYNDWSVDLDNFFDLFRMLKKPETVISMKQLLGKYYKPEEVDPLFEKLQEKYNEMKENGTISEFLSYGLVPYKLIGKYGSLDSSALFLLKASFLEDIDKKNELHGDEKSGSFKDRKFNLMNGYELWRKIHIAHIMMEMNGFYFNDKKVEKLNKWINEQSLQIMRYFVTSPLIDEWIRYKSFIHDFAFMLMEDHLDEIVDNEKEAKVMPIKNAMTKDHIKFYKPTKRFIKGIKEFNEYLYAYNLCLKNDINTDNEELITEFLMKNEYPEAWAQNLARNIKVFFNKLYQTKPAQYFNLEWTNKDGYIIKITWQQIIVLAAYSDFSFKEEQDKKYKEWLENKINSCKTFEDYKELFNVNSTTRDFRNYISDILLSDYKIKLGHTYYKLYELYESPNFSNLIDTLSNPINTKSGKTWLPPQNILIADFLLEVKKIIESKDIKDKDGNEVEVFSYEKLVQFEKLLNLDKFSKVNYPKFKNRPFYEDPWFGKGLTRQVGECFEWIIDKEYKLTSLDSMMMEHLTLLYGMIGCDVDDRSTWEDNKAFEFMFNYKLIKKLLKAKTTYVFGATGRSVAYYIPKYYYKDGDLFPKRVGHYEEGNDINDIYDKDLAIEIELENGVIRKLSWDQEVQLSDGTTKLAKDLTENDDIILDQKENDLLEEDLESDSELEKEEIFIKDED